MRIKRLGLFLALLVAILLPRASFAHPMGNFSVNHYSKITLQDSAIRVRYFIDLAEIPTYQELQAGSITATPNDPATTRFIAARGAELARGLSLSLDGKPLLLHLKSSGVIFPPGAGGLPTMKMGFAYEAPYPPGVSPQGAKASLHYADRNYPGHSGWKEIVAVASAGSLLKSSVPATDRSQELSNYPTDLLSSPPQDLDASIEAILPPTSAPASVAQTRVAPAPLPDRKSAYAATPQAPPLLAPHAATPYAPPPTTVDTGTKSAATLHTASVPVASRSSRSLPSVPPASTTSSSPASATSPAFVLKANQQQTPRNRFTELITAQRLSLWFLFTAALIAAGLGAMHALEPGHGKTIVAAYLVGSRGTARHAVLLGLIVTASHTAGVFALGAITLYASRYIVPEQLYPWLGVLSGLTIAGLGFYMLLRRLTGTAAEHSHAPGSSHTHWFARLLSRTTPAPDHQARIDQATIDQAQIGEVLINQAPIGQAPINQAQIGEAASKSPSLTQLFTLGITGGIIPCPAALIVLLSAFALHRIALGFFLIVAFSLGLAAVLIGFGMAMVYARRFMTRLHIDGPLTRLWLPIASAAFITILGLVVATQAFAATPLIPHLLSLHLLSKQKLGPLLFVAGLGLILGMRHSTDADHVVAISTIVSKQRSIRGAAFIGSVWGLGHTVTIFIVGSLIILFGVEIPPRVGLSMEFSVAIMLVLLGILNLTGVMAKITARFTPKNISNPSAAAAVAAAATVAATASPAGNPHEFRSRQLPSDRAFIPAPDVPASKKKIKIFQSSFARFGAYQCIRPLVIGLVHGLAGSAAVALLVLSTIHDPLWATLYLLIFGAGTMLGMMCMTAAMAAPLAFAGDRFTNLSRYMGVASGMVSLCFGSFLVYQLGFLGGLFTAHPQWTPR